jgi:hypothetical protein
MTSRTEYSMQTPKKSTLFSGQYLRNHWTLDIGVVGYIRIVWPKEHSPKVRSFPPGTPCICAITTHKMHCKCIITSQDGEHVRHNNKKCSAYMSQHHNKMHCIYVKILQDAQHTFRNITIIHAVFKFFCTVHYDIIMQHKPMKCTLLKLIFQFSFSIFNCLHQCM